MQDIEGRKAILLISSGIDTFSNLTFDKARPAIQNAGVPSTPSACCKPPASMVGPRQSTWEQWTFLQADNQMRTFTADTGACPSSRTSTAKSPTSSAPSRRTFAISTS